WTTAPDGWCANDLNPNFTCAPVNLVVVNAWPVGPGDHVDQGFDTLKITFDVPQTSVQLDIANTYLCQSPSATVTLNQVKLGTAVGSPKTLTLTQANAIAACSGALARALCGRFQVSADTGATFQEINIAPTTCSGATTTCNVAGSLDAVAEGINNCGGS